MVKDTFLYDKLGVSENATIEDIKKAYKILAVKLHPDKNLDDPDATKKFQEIQQAKEVLTNNEKRNYYNQFGMEYVNNNCTPPVQHNDMFNVFHGGNRQHKNDKEDIHASCDVSLEDLYNENTVKIVFSQKHYCVPCNGYGSKDGKTTVCTVCNGNGFVVIQKIMGPFAQQIQVPCNDCSGTGKTKSNSDNCNICKGEGFSVQNKMVNIQLKSFYSKKTPIVIQDGGNIYLTGKTKLIITINEKDHPVFKRDDNNLICNIELKLYQAIFGFDKIIEHLDKRKLYISHSGKTDNNTTKKISGEGFKNKGDLIIKFTYKLPNIENMDLSNKLLFVLKNIDQDEANNEVMVKTNKNSYVKTVMVNTEYNENKNNTQHFAHEFMPGFGGPMGGQPHINVGGQQCAQQ